MSASNKQWSKPQLIVLARGAPEESVLTFCKRIVQTGTIEGPLVASQYSCDDTNVNNCGNCQARAGS
jgi:hypothetical protein